MGDKAVIQFLQRQSVLWAHLRQWPGLLLKSAPRPKGDIGERPQLGGLMMCGTSNLQYSPNGRMTKIYIHLNLLFAS